MIDITHLLHLADEYNRAMLTEDKTVSSRAFGDSKKISALRAGADITVGRFNAAIMWFSDNWPEKACWPANISRPSATFSEPAE